MFSKKHLLIIILGVIGLLIIGIGISAAIRFNKQTTLSHEVDQKYATISVAIENRLDKFAELLDALNNAESHVERQLEKITNARSSLREKEELNGVSETIETMISETFVLIEDNPNTYIATSLYQSYMAEISATINMITTTKLQYNDKVTIYNTNLSKFPNNIYLTIFGFKPKALYNPNLVE